MRLYLLLVALFSLSSISLAQSGAPNQSDLEVKYDRFTDLTTAKSTSMAVTGEDAKEIKVRAWAIYKGEKLIDPKLSLRFLRWADYASGRTPLRYESVKTIYLLADAERFELPVKEYEGTKTPPFILEVAPVEITTDLAIALEKAKKVEARWGSSEITLTDESLRILKDFLRRMRS